MTSDERPTQPPTLAELEHDAMRLEWAERDAYWRMLRLIEEYPPTRDAFLRWQRVREEKTTTQARIDVLRAAKADRARREVKHGL